MVRQEQPSQKQTESELSFQASPATSSFKIVNIICGDIRGIISLLEVLNNYESIRKQVDDAWTVTGNKLVSRDNREQQENSTKVKVPRGIMEEHQTASNPRRR